MILQVIPVNSLFTEFLCWFTDSDFFPAQQIVVLFSKLETKNVKK